LSTFFSQSAFVLSRYLSGTKKKKSTKVAVKLPSYLTYLSSPPVLPVPGLAWPGRGLEWAMHVLCISTYLGT